VGRRLGGSGRRRAGRSRRPSGGVSWRSRVGRVRARCPRGRSCGCLANHGRRATGQCRGRPCGQRLRRDFGQRRDRCGSWGESGDHTPGGRRRGRTGHRWAPWSGGRWRCSNPCDRGDRKRATRGQEEDREKYECSENQEVEDGQRHYDRQPRL
jgi:hypothetical protein